MAHIFLKLEYEHQRLNDEHLALQETQRIYIDLLKLEEGESKAKDSFANAGSQDDTTQTILKRCIQGTKTLALVVQEAQRSRARHHS